MNAFQQILIGELIGLARATDGNEHLITEEITSVIRACLQASPENQPQLDHFLGMIEQAKRKMVPDCFLCTNPCGKNAPFHLQDIRLEPADVQDAKKRILQALRNTGSRSDPAAIYRGLIALGIEDLTPAFLNSIAYEIEA